MSRDPGPSRYLVDPPLTTRERSVRETAVEGLQLADSKNDPAEALQACRDTLTAIIVKLRGKPAHEN